jgi:hypothetical protein
VHNPGKVVLDVVLDVALAVADGGDCLADVGRLRAEPSVFGPVASDPTVSRLIGALASCGEKALRAIRSARAQVRARVGELPGPDAPDADGMRITCFPTNTARRPITELELRHRLRARAEDRIRAARAAPRDRPPPPRRRAEPHLAGDRPDRPGPAAWMPMLALTDAVRTRWYPDATRHGHRPAFKPDPPPSSHRPAPLRSVRGSLRSEQHQSARRDTKRYEVGGVHAGRPVDDGHRLRVPA